METKDEQFELCFQNLNKQQVVSKLILGCSVIVAEMNYCSINVIYCMWAPFWLNTLKIIYVLIESYKAEK